MCMQCMTESKLVIQNVIPGYVLTVATKDVGIWKAGMHALVWENDPTLVFPALMEDPLLYFTDDYINGLAFDSPEWIRYENYAEVVRECEFYNHVSLNESWGLVDACIQAGYDPDEDGDVMGWVVDYIARKLAVAEDSSNA